MSTRVQSGTLHGIDARAIEVEVDLLRRLPGVCIVGLAAAAVRESAERVRSAISSHGLEFPRRRVVVNLAPAGLPKVGAAFDLPIAVGVLAADGQVPADALGNVLLAGELSLDGRLRPVGGAIALAMLAREQGRQLIVPVEDACSASAVPGAVVFAATDLGAVVRHLRGEGALPAGTPTCQDPIAHGVDLADVRGQENVKRAAEIACAGALSLSMTGGPGCGKSMVSRRIPTLLPPLSFPELLEVSRIHSAAGLLRDGALCTARPFRAPHHSVTAAGMVGDRTLRPGEVSLAHQGVLFLDEAPEFKRSVLEVLRAPLEDREVTITRAHGTVRFPAAVSLVLAANPCPCGMRGTDIPCTCTDNDVRSYQRRLSGPILDRVDLHVHVDAVRADVLLTGERGESSEDVRTRVEAARAFVDTRGQRVPNGHLTASELEDASNLSPAAQQLLMDGVRRWSMTARSVARVIRVARTIADMEFCLHIGESHVAEALAYRPPVPTL